MAKKKSNVTREQNWRQAISSKISSASSLVASSLMFLFPKSTVPMKKKGASGTIKVEENITLSNHQNWSDLPLDIIPLIASKLSPSLDRFRLKGVCSPWRQAIKNMTRIPPLVLYEESADNLEETSDGEIVLSNEFFLFDDQVENKFQKVFSFVQQYSCINVLGWHPDGWVILSDENRVAYLLHLFRGIRIDLPNMSSNGRRVEDNTRKAILYANDPNRTEDFIVVMMSVKKPRPLALWRYGDRRWTCFGGKSKFLDIAVCKNTIYAIRDDPQLQLIYLESWDLESNMSLPQKKLSIGLFGEWVANNLVVSSMDEIYISDFSDWSSSTKRVIYKFDLSKKECVLVDSLNGQALFCGFGNSAILSASDAKRLRYEGNSVYIAGEVETHIQVGIYSYYHSRSGKLELQQLEVPSKMKRFGIFLV